MSRLRAIRPALFEQAKLVCALAAVHFAATWLSFWLSQPNASPLGAFAHFALMLPVGFAYYAGQASSTGGFSWTVAAVFSLFNSVLWGWLLLPLGRHIYQRR